MSLATLLDRHAAYRTDATALVHGDARYTWRELRDRVDRLITGLSDAGIGHGDHVALLLDNCVPLVELYWAAAKAGIVVVPLSPWLRGTGLVSLITDSDAVAIVAMAHVATHLEAVRGELTHISADRWFIVGDETPGYRPYRELTARDPEAPVRPAAISDDDLYNIIYSSGTTGLPKGIVHTHEVREAYCTGFATGYRISQDSVIIHSGSLVFNGAFLTVMPWVLTGCTFVLMPRFDAGAMVELMGSEKATHAMLVPSQIVQLLEDDRFDAGSLSHVEMLCSVGAPLLLDHKLTLIERFPDRCYELYGLTEGFVTILDRSDFVEKAGSVGVPPPLYEMRIVDDDGNEVPAGMVGEIADRSYPAGLCQGGPHHLGRSKRLPQGHRGSRHHPPGGAGCHRLRRSPRDLG